MRIRVDSIHEGSKPIEGTVDPTAMQLDDSYCSFDKPLTFSGYATRNAEDVRVKGSLTGSIKSQCSRCLEAFTMTIDLVMDTAFVPRRGDSEDEDGTFEPGSILSYYDGDSIDLLQEIKDLILVNLPIKPICRPDCRGLCPQCGAELNKSPCQCEQDKGLSPFDKLKELKSKLK
jgi:uncharacterized protein